ncbi:hypothetical protein RJ639_038525 [Escallonia herrerae]|uniref:Uncharacterized protein n=1 Tax=Escallonia herrerae TaxID=1293975 RepID=A0AA88WMB2_9ASTE|nr:hypothetical protein RJ639_038525 [Escallonia herrerae]
MEQPSSKGKGDAAGVTSSGSSGRSDELSTATAKAMRQANVLTGLVNLFVDTLFVSSVSALIILIVYAFVLSAFVSFADFYGMKLKFW